MAQTFPITVSSIVACWRLIRISSRYSPISVEAAIQTVQDSGLVEGNLPANDGLRLGLLSKIFSIDENSNLELTPFCQEKLTPLCDVEEPNVQVSRAILLGYMSGQNFDWLLFFDQDPSIFKIGIPVEWIELLENSELFDFDSLEVTAWWAQVYDRFEKYQEGKKLEQGKVAEKLTFDSEKARLATDGFDHGAKFVKWASHINDKFGFDILSIRGGLLKGSHNIRDKIHIEVKCTAANDLEKFRFFVSRNEWNVANDNIQSYYFYCWVNANTQKETAEGPFIIPALKLASQVPKDQSNICGWSECRFVLDLRAMKIN